MEVEKYLELIIKKCHNKLSSEEESLLYHWLQESSENEKIQEDVQKIWDVTENYQKSYAPTIAHGVEKFQKALNASAVEDNYTELMVKAQQGTASTTNQASLESWINQSSDNAGLHEDTQKVWGLTQQYQTSYQPDAQKGFARFQQELAKQESTPEVEDTSDDVFADLITKKLSGDITPEEVQQLDNWLAQNPENEHLYEDLAQVWANTSHYQESYQPDAAQGFARFSQSLANATQQSSPPVKELKHKSSRRSFGMIGIAATVAILFVAGYFLLFNQPKDTNVVVATTNTTQTVTLPDGSTVSLNKNSELSYNKKFDTRIVNLKGEAFFEVTKQNGKPFSILSNGTKTEVLGTSFNIKASEQNQDVEVTVLTGKVAVSLEKEPKKKVLLVPGDKAVYQPKTALIKKEKSSNKNFLAWKTLRLAFDNNTLKNIIPELEKLYQIKIVLGNEKMLNCRFTGTFDNVKLEEALEIIKFTFNASYTKSGNTYTIKGKGCN